MIASCWMWMHSSRFCTTRFCALQWWYYLVILFFVASHNSTTNECMFVMFIKFGQTERMLQNDVCLPLTFCGWWTAEVRETDDDWIKNILFIAWTSSSAFHSGTAGQRPQFRSHVTSWMYVGSYKILIFVYFVYILNFAQDYTRLWLFQFIMWLLERCLPL